MSEPDPLEAIPPALLHAPQHELWIRLEADGSATLGATHLAVRHGEFLLFTPRPVGHGFVRDASIGVMETGKSVIAIHAPLSGRILAINAAAVADARLVNRDPYGAGWLMRVEPISAIVFAAERAAWLDAAGFRAWVGRLPQASSAASDPSGSDEFDPTRVW
jgi:glycine cleavage system H lipoate-binding protein